MCGLRFTGWTFSPGATLAHGGAGARVVALGEVAAYAGQAGLLHREDAGALEAVDVVGVRVRDVHLPRDRVDDHVEEDGADARVGRLRLLGRARRGVDDEDVRVGEGEPHL